MCLFCQEKVKTISKKILFFSTQEKKTETFLPLPLVQSWLHVKSGTTREGIPSPLESHSSLKASSIKRTEKYKEILTTFESGEKRGEEKSYCMDFLITRNHNDEMKEEWEIENFLTRGDTARVASNSRCVFHHRQDDEETRSLFDSVWLLINVFLRFLFLHFFLHARSTTVAVTLFCSRHHHCPTFDTAKDWRRQKRDKFDTNTWWCINKERDSRLRETTQLLLKSGVWRWVLWRWALWWT